MRLNLTRRSALAASGLGLGIVTSFKAGAKSIGVTAAEKANIQVVNQFCAAWPSHDIDRVMSFFADGGAYRMTETQEPHKGKQAVKETIQSFLDRVERFEVIETLAKGPLVINERHDHFSGGPLKTWHGVGMFFLKDRKIVEWYDYTISIERT